MPSVGPSLPPGKAEKRKREAGSEDDEAIHKAPRSSNSRSTSPSASAKTTRSIGPTFPPASLSERPPQPPDGDASSSSDDDGFGPSLPTTTYQKSEGSNCESSVSAGGQQAPLPVKSQRDEWMIVPPSGDDWSSRVDPTKLKNRKFNTGKGSKGPTQTSAKESNTSWTETLDEKKARLQREMMGIKDISAAKAAPHEETRTRENARTLQEYSVSNLPLLIISYKVDSQQEKSRGSTLYKEHQKTNPQEKEDDPSARPFDREKDIAGGMKINNTQRRELMNKAADFGSRFSSGKFL
jgi:Protein of unknown function (DUF3752)